MRRSLGRGGGTVLVLGVPAILDGQQLLLTIQDRVFAKREYLVDCRQRRCGRAGYGFLIWLDDIRDRFGGLCLIRTANIVVTAVVDNIAAVIAAVIAVVIAGRVASSMIIVVMVIIVIVVAPASAGPFAAAFLIAPALAVAVASALTITVAVSGRQR
ncbi:MAG: hypothetical protein JSU82_12105 [Rhodospirillales bacterium]|nr:MAG: hypothetical protein JSU82_12105 [Rhodospirillales bacterium]